MSCKGAEDKSTAEYASVLLWKHEMSMSVCLHNKTYERVIRSSIGVKELQVFKAFLRNMLSLLVGLDVFLGLKERIDNSKAG